MAEMTKQDAIEEIAVISKKFKDGRYKDHFEMKKRMDELAARFGITYGDIWSAEAEA